MSAFADTSFLCALYREEEIHSPLADRYMGRNPGPVYVSSLVLLEFRQAARLHVYRFSREPSQGYSAQEAERMIKALGENVASGGISLRDVDWSQVHARAEKISRRHTTRHGSRLIDILHVATAVCLEADDFLSFDETQRAVAKSEGLRLRPGR